MLLKNDATLNYDIAMAYYIERMVAARFANEGREKELNEGRK